MHTVLHVGSWTTFKDIELRLFTYHIRARQADFRGFSSLAIQTCKREFPMNLEGGQPQHLNTNRKWLAFSK
jgi:hypothetical protein